jgi:hypothetical protein
MPKGLQGFQKGHPQFNSGRTHFKKGIHPKTEIKKGQHLSVKTEFKKGATSWIKGKHPEYLQGKNHPMYGIHNLREKSPNWRCGKTIDKDGYVFIYKPEHPFCNNKGYVRRSRLVMEEHLGRYLKPIENIHHINKITNDDRIKNLMLFANNSAHIKFHHLIKNNS